MSVFRIQGSGVRGCFWFKVQATLMTTENYNYGTRS